MKFYWIKTSWIIKKLFSHYIWDVSQAEQDKTVYLTFDDGPIPVVTPWVLNQLELYHAKATFFCIGDNINKNPEIFVATLNAGHTIGNHTNNHCHGWKTTTEKYIENCKICADIIQKNSSSDLKSPLFRPPYGKIKVSQSRQLRNLGYKIIMWDILSADFDISISQEQCLDNVLSNVEHGSIIVFHDSAKAFKNLSFVLPKTLAYLKENNFTCGVL